MKCSVAGAAGCPVFTISTLLLKGCHKKQEIIVNTFRMFGPGSERHWVPNESHDVIRGTHLGAAHDVQRE